MIRFNPSKATAFMDKEKLDELYEEAKKAEEILLTGKGKGSEYIGWRDLPLNYDKEELNKIVEASDEIRKNYDTLVVIGIGGSYLGAKMVVDALSCSFFAADDFRIVYAGNGLSSDYTAELLDYLKGRNFCINVISKSGTTTEPAIAYRLIKNLMNQKYGADETEKRTYITTDKEKGALRELANLGNYETFLVPDDIGGRYSVLTAVGLLPIAAAGFDVKKLLSGAATSREKYGEEILKYAATRNALSQNGYHTEIYLTYEPKLKMLIEWLKQLFGESEGKEGKGIFPAGLVLTTDLHSMGQYVQDGRRILFETNIAVKSAKREVIVPKTKDDMDGLNYLAGRSLDDINKVAAEATSMAHFSGGVANMTIEMDELNEENMGELIYFFEKACAISGYMNDINPFDQPGVESYKNNMFALLGKPGYERK